MCRGLREALGGLLLLVGCGRVGFDLGSDATTADGAPADPCALAAPGLLGAWSLDAVSVDGTSVHDTSGLGRDGTLIGAAPASVAGRSGEALDFAGTTLTYVDLPSVPLDSTPGKLTSVSLWMWNDDPNVDEAIACLPTGPTTAPPRYSLWLATRLGPAALCINSGMGDCWGIVDPGLLGRWVHVVAIYANGPTVGGQLFVDGTPVTASCVFGVCDQARAAMPPFSIACSDPQYAWHGRLDEVRVFDRALTPGEVDTLYRCPL